MIYIYIHPVFIKLFKIFKGLFLVALLFSNLFPHSVPAQFNQEMGLPMIFNYSTKIYKSHPQVWSIVQDDEGIMYFGTSTGIIEYDGVNWKQIKIPGILGTTIVRAMVKNEDGVVFYGTAGDFGYLEIDSIGHHKAVSLKELVPEQLRDFNDIWTIQFTGDHIYFQARELIIRIESKKGKADQGIKTWKPETNFSSGFYINNEYYVHQLGLGLYKMVNGDFQLVSGSEFLGKDRSFVMLPYKSDFNNDGKFLTATFSSGLYLYNGKEFIPFATEVHDLIKSSLFYKAIQLSNGNYAFSLIGYGLMILDPEGKKINLINTESGLQDESVYSLFTDRSGILWLGLENGIAKVELNAPITLFSKQSGLKTGVMSIERAGGVLYIGTPIGLYYFNKSSQTFEQIPEFPPSQIFNIAKDGKSILIPGSGIFYSEGNKSGLLNTNVGIDFYSNIIFLSKQHPDILYTGGSSGLSVFSRVKQQNKGNETFRWKHEGDFKSLSKDIYTIIETRDGDIWCGTQNGIVYKVTPNWNSNGTINFSNSLIETFGPENGLINSIGSVFSVDGNAYFPANSGLFTFDSKTKLFRKDSILGMIPRNIPISEEFYIKEDSLGRVWLPLGNQIRLATPLENGGYKIEDNLFNVFPWESMTVIYPESDGIVWVGGSEGLIRLDEKIAKRDEQKFNVLLRQITSGKDSLNHQVQEKGSMVPKLKNTSNSLRFLYAAPFFEQEDRTLYQTKLEGFDEEWSDWDKNSYKEYTNLSSGTYTFRVRSKNIHNTISEDAVYSFTILPPWYASWWAILLYFLLFSLIVLLLNRIQKQRLIAKERERTKEKELAQAKEIEKAYHELEDVYKNLEVTHENLKSVQSQLIQQEKLASLGQLTAGIAHEIKNPLNFINNFSDLNMELIEEVFVEIAEIEKNNRTDEIIKILEDVKSNLSKIHQHGTRADGIVRSMLLHSRGGSGKIEPIDLNAFIKEYVNLSFHGMRAGKKAINASIEMDLDSSVGKIPIIAEDFSRIILNLCNNAFDAMREKLFLLSKNEEYTPTLTIRTLQKTDTIQIDIEDNGLGIPDNIKEKILQPFFTTKKGTEGTGLGLSITHDIIKAHNGTIHICSEEGKFSCFTIILPKTLK